MKELILITITLSITYWKIATCIEFPAVIFSTDLVSIFYLVRKI